MTAESAPPTRTNQAGGAAPGTGRIGPNAITRVVEALLEIEGAERTRRVLRRARLDHDLRHPPVIMVPETRVTALHATLIEQLGTDRARAISRRAGALTARYLLAHRIPLWVQPLLRRLPAHPASRILLRAITRNAWTFSGSGELGLTGGKPVEVSIHGCPLCASVNTEAAVCDYYAATFGGLFRQLVAPSIKVDEIACRASGDEACVFRIDW
jgi:divinyl protochlorophyllide a 8-vinyl-reductase